MESRMADEITLVLPRDRDFASVANLVMGGLAVRLNLTFEELEDIELALDGLLGRDDGDGEVTVALQLEDTRIRASIGPFSSESLRRDLEPEAADAWSLRRVLETVADEVEIGERDGGHWVELTKTIHPAPRESD
jgi:anti-sigma regulatory factor (Ser/Thr protein kinase)